MLWVNIKKTHPDAVIPKYAKPGDAGLDLVAVEKSFETNAAGIEMVSYRLGIAVEIPEGYVGLIFPRSSICKTNLNLANSVGVIDSGYRGEIVAKFAKLGSGGEYEIGDRVCQLVIMPHPKVQFVEVEELSVTSRGSGGFGSSGR